MFPKSVSGTSSHKIFGEKYPDLHYLAKNILSYIKNDLK